MSINAILQQSPIIPVIVIDTLEHAIPLAKTFADAGITTLEITLRTDHAIEAIKQIKKQLPQCTVGAGTLATVEQFQALKDVQADFAVSPGINTTLITAAKQHQIPFLPGIATPSDILLAIEHHSSTLKFFPAGLNGGIAALKNFGSVFPGIKFCPTGGINADNLFEFLDLDNVLSVGGSWLAPRDLLQSQDWEAIYQLATAAIKEVK